MTGKTFTSGNMIGVIQRVEKEKLDKIPLKRFHRVIAEQLDTYNSGIIVRFCKAMDMAGYITTNTNGEIVMLAKIQKKEESINVGDNKEGSRGDSGAATTSKGGQKENKGTGGKISCSGFLK